MRVREALNISVNRELLNQTFWDGNAIPQLIHGFPPTHPDFKHDDWTPYPFDPERARQLLTEAGYPDGFTFDFQTSVVSGVHGSPRRSGSRNIHVAGHRTGSPTQAHRIR